MEENKSARSRTRSKTKKCSTEKNKNNEQRESSDEGDGLRNAEIPAIEEQIEPKNKKIWRADQVLQTIEERGQYFADNSFWKIKYTNKRVAGGKKTYYYCNFLGRTKNTCSAELCVFERSDATDFILHRCCEHTHADNVQSTKVGADVYDKIKKMREKGMTQRLISHDLRTDDNIGRAPTENQVEFQFTVKHKKANVFVVLWLFFAF